MKLSLFASIALILMACGKEPHIPNEVRADVEEYLALFGGSADDVVIHFERWEGTTAGLCKQGKITLNTGYWDRFTNQQQRVLVWHELGHCLADLGHTDKTEIGGCPASIMSTYLPQPGCADFVVKQARSGRDALLPRAVTQGREALSHQHTPSAQTAQQPHAFDCYL